MKIRANATSTFRFTERAAASLERFLRTLSVEPKNMNDAMNIALAALPTNTFIDDFVELDRDHQSALIGIRKRYDASGILRRVDWYFLVMRASMAIKGFQGPSVKPVTIRAILEMTQAAYGLLKSDNSAVRDDHYFLGNLGGLMGYKTLEERLIHLLEDVSKYTSTSAAEFALRNIEVMLRDDLAGTDPLAITSVLSPYFRQIFRIATRSYFHQNQSPLEEVDASQKYAPNFQGFYGTGNILHVTQWSSLQAGFIVSLPGDRNSASFCANNIEEIDIFAAAFLSKEAVFESKCITVSEIYPTRDRFLALGRVRVSLKAEDFSTVRDAFRDFYQDPLALTALAKSYDMYGEV
ncbi:hypothetical protein M2305_003173 [Gluconobacter cerinus]|uniref:hypothetical protein n=1 Tax=Gluconobacter cerinus TaxID=38307 RepID=UPI002225E6A3|nr:hypothetical protein [Gluconobacter cerinus]MCW2267154.1 hypothetical protein [Gluconobacter cerinus]